MRVQRANVDVLPLTWEVTSVTVASWGVLGALALPVGHGLACVLRGRDFTWPNGALVRSLLGLHSGHGGEGLTAAQAAGLPSSFAVYATVSVLELILVAVLGWAVALWRRAVGPGAQFGMADRGEVAAVLGPGNLRCSRRIIRPDLLGSSFGQRVGSLAVSDGHSQDTALPRVTSNRLAVLQISRNASWVTSSDWAVVANHPEHQPEYPCRCRVVHTMTKVAWSPRAERFSSAPVPTLSARAAPASPTSWSGSPETAAFFAELSAEGTAPLLVAEVVSPIRTGLGAQGPFASTVIADAVLALLTGETRIATRSTCSSMPESTCRLTWWDTAGQKFGPDRQNEWVTQPYPQSPRTSPMRNSQRVSYDRETVQAVLDEAVVCHVGFVVDGRPVVLPHLHARRGEVLYLHGSTGARALNAARGDGLEVCVTVTLLDGLVLARSAFHHSVNYRSVVVHGMAVVVEDQPEKITALAALVEAVAPGRTGGTRPPSRKELGATTVLRLDLHEVSVKVRSGPPNDEAEDLGLPYWAGVLPLTTTPGAAQPDGDLPDNVVLPEHVTAWKRPGTS